MKKLESTLPNMILSLGLITVISGVLLGGAYAITKDPIDRQAEQLQTQAIAEVTPHFTNNPEADKWTTTIDNSEFTVYPAYDCDKLVGAAVKGSSMNGFGGEITVMAGFDDKGTVTGYKVLQHAETPGLGSKMETWFRDPQGARSVIGKNPDIVSFFVSKDPGGEIDGITAATITSRAFLEIMRNAFAAYRNYENQHVEKK